MVTARRARPPDRQGAAVSIGVGIDIGVIGIGVSATISISPGALRLGVNRDRGGPQ
jgi:hypothetical protein